MIQGNLLYLAEQGHWCLEAPSDLSGFVTH